ncbi:MAG: hypothetical protein HY818_11155 [Acetobacterium woodii]|nr:hypothetical protein [Acetobacterium woodii]
MTIPETVTSIGAMAFKNHPFTTITMPANVSIGADSETMGTNGTGFQAAYMAGSSGTYTFQMVGASSI